MSEIEYSGRVPLNGRDVIKLLEKNGWRLMWTKGDNRIFGDGEGRTTIICGRVGDDIRPGNYSAIFEANSYQGP